MPGLNQRGPSNEGPMTGGRRGVCTGIMGPGQHFSGRDMAGCFRGRGRGFGRRECLNPARGLDFDEGLGRQTVQQDAAKESLKNRAKFLEAELETIKSELANLSEPNK